MSVERRVGKKYRLGRKLGSGSFGEVWHGTDVTSGKQQFFVITFIQRLAQLAFLIRCSVLFSFLLFRMFLLTQGSHPVMCSSPSFLSPSISLLLVLDNLSPSLGFALLSC